MCSKRQLSRATVQDLHSRLQHAYGRDDVRLVRRITGWIDLRVPHGPVTVLGERWGLSPSCLYDWPKALLLRGLDSLGDGHRGGRRPQWTPRQQQRVVELSEAGPLVGGCETAWWHSVLIRGLLWRALGVRYTRHEVCPLLQNLGFALHKARWVSAHLDAAKRLAGGKVAVDCTGCDTGPRVDPVGR